MYKEWIKKIEHAASEIENEIFRTLSLIICHTLSVKKIVGKNKKSA